MADEQFLNRRQDDRDRALNARLDQLERGYQGLQTTVNALDGSLTIVKHEQVHLKELFTARLGVIEKAQEILLSKIEQLGRDMNTAWTDVERSPIARQLQQVIDGNETKVGEQGEKLEKHEKIHEELRAWQNRVDGAIFALKWLAALGTGGLALTVLRMLIGK